METISPSFKIEKFLDRPDMLKSIELYGRVAYKSEDKITDDSAISFVRKVLKSGHESVIEHASFDFLMELGHEDEWPQAAIELLQIKEHSVGLHYTKVGTEIYLSANARTIRDAARFAPNAISRAMLEAARVECPVLFEDFRESVSRDDNFWGVNEQYVLNELQPDQAAKHIYATVRFICDRGITHEIVRHRLCSFTQESTRYCNYFKRGIQFIKPCFWNKDDAAYQVWLLAMGQAEKFYNIMMNDSYNCSPQQARSVLPNSLKTEIIVTANLTEWQHIFKLRADSHAHPQMQELMYPLKADFHNRLPELF